MRTPTTQAGNRTIEQIDDAVTLSAYDNLNRLTSQAPGGPMIIVGTLNEPGTVTISGTPAVVDGSNNFRGTVPTVTGTNTFTIVAKDATGNTTTQQYEVDVAGTGRSISFDAAGNMASDGVSSYLWNAKQQLVQIDRGTETVTFAYGSLDRLARLSFLTSGVEQSREDYIWCHSLRCATRDASGAETRRWYRLGQVNDSESVFVGLDQVGSVRALTDDSGGLVAHLDFDPWGPITL